MTTRTVWVATAEIFLGSGSSVVRAYNPRDIVPDAVVSEYGLDLAGHVAQITVEDGVPSNHHALDFATQEDLEATQAALADLSNSTEARISRVGAAAGQVPVLQADGTFAMQPVTSVDVGAIDADDIADGTDKVVMTASERTKLAGVATSATANATNAQLRDRTTHTGTQPITTVSGLQGALDGKAPAAHSHGVADLTATGTKDSTTFLRGDNTWAAPAGGGASPTLANIPAGSTLTVLKSGSTWPARPTARTDIVVAWKGADPSPAIVTSGTGGMLDNVDYRLVTP